MRGARDLIVFDMDGTLIDSQKEILSGMHAGFAATGHAAPSDTDILAIVGLSIPEAIAVLAPDLPTAEQTAIATAFRQSFQAARASGGGEAAATLYPGARAALERLQRRADTVLGVATGKARPGLDHAFACHGLGHFFTTTQTADAHPSKPHPSMLLRALQETGTEATRAVIIGDTEFDIAMGRAAGFATVAVSWGYHPVARLQAAGADLVINDFDALDAAIAILGERRLV